MTAQFPPLKAKRVTDVEMTWEHISPTRAKTWLKALKETGYAQRGLSAAAADRYAGDMARGEWHSDTGVPILLTVSGGHEVPLDGQTRLSGIVRSDVGIDSWVARNVPGCAFKYVDNGQPRTLKDVMVAAGYSDPTVLSAAGAQLWKESLTGSPMTTPSGTDRTSAGNTLDWLAEHVPDLESYWLAHKSAIKAAQKNKQGSAATLLYLHYALSKLDGDLTAQWFDYLIDPMLRTPSQRVMAYCSTAVSEIVSARKGLKSHAWTDSNLMIIRLYEATWDIMRGHQTAVRSVGGLKSRALESDKARASITFE
jgi:hypothetical protein